MKLVHISDIHINSSPILDADSAENFARCPAHVETFHLDSDRVVIPGDLTHHGESANYRILKQMIDSIDFLREDRLNRQRLAGDGRVGNEALAG